MNRGVWFRDDLVRCADKFCAANKEVNFNSLVNTALDEYLGKFSDFEEVALGIELRRLKREEKDLKEMSRIILRSGAYLPAYAEKVLMTQKGKPNVESPFYEVGQDEGRKRTLSKTEEEAFRRICSAREAAVARITVIANSLLKYHDPLRLPNERHKREVTEALEDSVPKDELAVRYCGDCKRHCTSECILRTAKRSKVATYCMIFKPNEHLEERKA